MKRLNWESIGKGVLSVCTGLAYGAVLAVACGSKITITHKKIVNGVGDVNLSDAVDAIMNSDMFDSYKLDAVELLKTDGDSGYYKSVISAINSDMYDSYKIDVIKKLSE